MKTRYLFAFALFLLFSFNAFSQKHELGFAIGGLNYTGELAQDFRVLNYRPALYGFYKLNVDPAFGLKFALLGGRYAASDLYNVDPLPQARRRESGSTIFEFFAVGEYNFFDFRKERDRRRISPYLTGGLSFFAYSINSNIRTQTGYGNALAIPFGLGTKFQLSKKTNLGIEFIARKTFTDLLEGISSYKLSNGLETGDPYSNDWFYFTGITFSYTFYSVDCPAHFR